jgi:hypothetical protein
MTTASIVAALYPDSSDRDAAGGAPQDAGFATQGAFAAHFLSVSVEGYGLLPVPLMGPDVTRLQALAQPAAFGLRDQTLVDPQVRDSAEIAAHALTLTGLDAVWADLQRQIRSALHLPHAQLDLQLHNLLLYGEEQFFKWHQDTEKLPGMVATLVLVWPCAHVGGHLVVQRGQETLRFVSENLNTDQVQWCIFYADCQHELRKVTHGNRVALTFNVCLNAQESGLESVPPNAKLEAALAAHFPNQSESTQPNRLVFFLNHQYTEHGLRWPLLKGVDRMRALDLRSAAKALDLQVYLALVEIHETWTVDMDHLYTSSRSRIKVEPTPEDLIESSTTLDFWVNQHDEVVELGGLSIRDAQQLCWALETDEDFLVDSEYEGYMGNYGETLDYWYRRAAVVLWPTATALVQAFQMNFDAALAILVGMAQEPKLAGQVEQCARAVLAKLQHMAAMDSQRLHAHCQLAAGIQDRALMLALLENFKPQDFRADHVAALRLVQQAHGSAVLHALLDRWDSLYTVDKEAASIYYRYQFVEHSAAPMRWETRALIAALLDCKCEADWQADWVARWVLHRIALFQALDQVFIGSTLRVRQQSWAWRLQTLTDLLGAACSLPDSPLPQTLLAYTIAQPVLYPPIDLAPLLIDLGSTLPTLPQAATLRDAVRTALRTALAQAPRARDDMRLSDAGRRCRCTDCDTLFAFAGSNKPSISLGISDARRRHVIEAFTEANLPLAYSILRQGSPHKLVLSKYDQLHTLDQQQRAQWQRWLEALDV